MFHKVVWQHMQGVMGFLIATLGYCKYAPVKEFWKSVKIWQISPRVWCLPFYVCTGVYMYQYITVCWFAALHSVTVTFYVRSFVFRPTAYGIAENIMKQIVTDAVVKLTIWQWRNIETTPCRGNSPSTFCNNNNRKLDAKNVWEEHLFHCWIIKLMYKRDEHTAFIVRLLHTQVSSLCRNSPSYYQEDFQWRQNSLTQRSCWSLAASQ